MPIPSSQLFSFFNTSCAIVGLALSTSTGASLYSTLNLPPVRALLFGNLATALGVVLGYARATHARFAPLGMLTAALILYTVQYGLQPYERAAQSLLAATADQATGTAVAMAVFGLFAQVLLLVLAHSSLGAFGILTCWPYRKGAVVIALLTAGVQLGWLARKIEDFLFSDSSLAQSIRPRPSGRHR